MPRERSLLERLAEPERGPDRTTRQNIGLLADSVLANLRRVLNSRHGSAQIAGDYGIPDLSDVLHSFPESTGKMRAAIKAAIEKYEPRLKRVRVRAVDPPDDDVLSLHFEITAQLVTARDRGQVLFETRVAPSGEVRLRG